MISAKKTKAFIIILLVLGIPGTVVFFPVNIDNRYTCLYHRLFIPHHLNPHSSDSSIANSHRQIVNPGSLTHHRRLTKEEEPVEISYDEIMARYVTPFGFLWWGSLLLVATGVYVWKKFNRSQRSKFVGL
ncbi:MAG: hypothetical protein GWN01_01125, partial [Nitrosopumilaceae archaeon]|nr:hypothetical protein [Nitrosopumilaceae archaeon]NIU85968.1 hypothetical protein [Nitrosopumilaceae archaeon]NIX60182.1 hypothetical protein [Nitrosopumilaceae archaeon]